MTAEEFKLFAAGLKSAYPSQNFLPDEYAMKTWYRLLKDIDYSIATTTAYKYICSNRFPPTICDIRTGCSEIAAGDKKDWLECWNKIQAVRGRYGYNRPNEAYKALEAFDPLTARVARMMGWYTICTSEKPAVDRANFRECYESLTQRSRESEKLPPGIRDDLRDLAQSFRADRESALSSVSTSQSQNKPSDGAFGQLEAISHTAIQELLNTLKFQVKP